MDKLAGELSKYRFEKATEELEIAKKLFRENYFAKSLNSSYYSMFHATSALLAIQKVDSKKHAGLINFFSNLYIKTKKIPEQYFTFISKAFNIRMQSDHKDFYVATKQDAETQIQNAEKFLEMVKDYLSKNTEY
jgi:uncharacterized protein (UPF0332 family)